MIWREVDAEADEIFISLYALILRTHTHTHTYIHTYAMAYPQTNTEVKLYSHF